MHATARPVHARPRRRPAALLAGLLLGATALAGWTSPAAEAATVVATSHCRQLDPNLVHGTCLHYRSGSGSGYTWLGTLRAANGRVFFCIDYLYDSRIAGRPRLISTQNLVNQLGRRVGDREVAALNYVISTWAGRGSTGSDHRDAAIALLIRELMSDGIRPGGAVVYPTGLKVGGAVRAPTGGLSGAVLPLARSMWAEASRSYGPLRLSLTTTSTGNVELGTTRTYQAAAVSAAGNRVAGVRVSFTCTGPIVCPSPVLTRSAPVAVAVTPRAVGAYAIRATASGPDDDGTLYVVGSWHPHGGSTAQDAGVQRGWIAQRSTASAAVSASAEIVKGTPRISTRTSSAQAVPGDRIADVVTTAEVPVGYRGTATATLYGPFTQQPGVDSCTADTKAGEVTFPVTGNGTWTTPAVTVTEVGYYVWTEAMPGDVRTNATTTPCGVVEESTLVAVRPVVPTVRTTTSDRHVLVGGSVRDTVVIAGLPAGSRVAVAWVLHGPVPPRNGSCDGLDWSSAPVLDHGTFTATGNGSYTTAATLLPRPGCTTY
ncbi:MAG: hypothetical protein ACJ72D_17630, partial [Marmoricola sp.]